MHIFTVAWIKLNILSSKHCAKKASNHHANLPLEMYSFTLEPPGNHLETIIQKWVHYFQGQVSMVVTGFFVLCIAMASSICPDYQAYYIYYQYHRITEPHFIPPSLDQFIKPPPLPLSILPGLSKSHVLFQSINSINQTESCYELDVLSVPPIPLPSLKVHIDKLRS